MSIISIGGFFHDLNFTYYEKNIGQNSLISLEEERFSRVKQHKVLNKKESTLFGIDYILNKNKINYSDIDILLFSDNNDQSIYQFLIKKFRNAEVIRIGHHLSHLGNITAFYPDLWQESLICIFDAFGDGFSGLTTEINNGFLKNKYHNKKDSLGMIYTAATSHIGLGSFGSEGKLQGLASYGEYNSNFSIKKFLDIKEKEIIVDSLLRESTSGPRQEMYSESIELDLNLFHEFLPKRFADEQIEKSHIDFAFTIQQDIFSIIAEYIGLSVKSYKNIGIGGGLAQNSTLIGFLNHIFKDNNIFTTTSCSDRGNSLGALSYYLRNKNIQIKKHLTPFLGFDANYLSNDYWDKNFEKVDCKNYIYEAARLINEGYLIASYCGRAEYGARALGNRSILANPTSKNMRNYLNKEIKHREDFRPFAPMVLEDTFNKYFSKRKDLHWMTECIKPSKDFVENSPSAVHVDGSCRVQVIKNDSQISAIKELLEILEKEYQILSLINTSLNDAGEAIVNNENDLFKTMKSCSIKYVITSKGLFKLR